MTTISVSFFLAWLYLIGKSLLNKAVLRMFCNTKNTSSITLIKAQIPEANSLRVTEIAVQNAGWYEWNLTEMIHALDTIEHFSICLCTSRYKFSKAKMFCSQLSSYPISLQLTTEDDKESNTYEYKEDYLACLGWKYSKWLGCSAYKSYVYHVYNGGTNAVEIRVNISPDKAHYTESGIIYTVQPNSLIVIEPMQYSFYIRTAFKNISSSEGNDSITIYGNDGTDNKVLKTNATGQLDIRPLTEGDTVSVVITEASDSILIYGNDGTANQVLKTDGTGVLQVNYTPAFVDVTVINAQATANTYTFSDGQDISNSTAYAFFVNNTGITNSATVKIQLSPDDVTWVDDGDEVVVGEGTATIITANKFLKYIRIGYQSTMDDASTTITAVFQAQGQ